MISSGINRWDKQPLARTSVHTIPGLSHSMSKLSGQFRTVHFAWKESFPHCQIQPNVTSSLRLKSGTCYADQGAFFAKATEHGNLSKSPFNVPILRPTGYGKAEQLHSVQLQQVLNENPQDKDWRSLALSG